MQKLSVVYFGTPSFSADFLEMMINDKELPVKVKHVVTQPDKPVGRKQIMSPTAVKLIAKKYHIPVSSTPGVEEADLAIVFAYRKILPKEILDIPKFGFWNIHPSLLPLYRGTSPIAYPLFNGDTKTGVTLMQMDEKMDHGPIIDQVQYSILPFDRRPDLETKLTRLGYDLLKRVVLNLFQDPHKIPKHIRDDKFKQQDDSRATYTRFLHKQDGFIPLQTLKKALQGESLKENEIPLLLKEYSQKYLKSKVLGLKSSEIIYNLYRGLYPWPGIWTHLQLDWLPAGRNNAIKRLKITEMALENKKLVIKKVQLEGKNEVDYKTFVKAYGEI